MTPTDSPSPQSREAAISDEEIDAIQAETDCFVCDCCDVRVHEFARAVAAFVSKRALAATVSAPSAPEQPISNKRADAIHSMPWVRDCLLRYVDRPCDKEARDVVRAITNAHAGLMVGAQPPVSLGKADTRDSEGMGGNDGR